MAKTSQDITAGMVTVSYEEINPLTFSGWMDIRIKRAQEWGSGSSSSEANSFQSEAPLIASIAVDEEMMPINDT